MTAGCHLYYHSSFQIELGSRCRTAGGQDIIRFGRNALWEVSAPVAPPQELVMTVQAKQ